MVRKEAYSVILDVLIADILNFFCSRQIKNIFSIFRMLRKNDIKKVILIFDDLFRTYQNHLTGKNIA